MKKITLKEFIQRSKEIHGNKYDYSKTIYKSALEKVEIMCPTHGSFFQIASHHYNRGQGCPKCKFEKLSTLYMKSTERFIKDAIKIHENEYDYSKSKYKGSSNKIKIICSIHGSFFQTPGNHLYRKRGCPKCKGGVKINTKTFVKRAKKIHGNKYDYSKINYTNSITRVEIICIKHGPFFQTPNTHLSGSGCRACNFHKSKASQIWLNSLIIPHLIREKLIYVGDRKFVVDGLDPSTDTIYEYNGSFWHGNPDLYDPSDINKVNGKSFGQLYQETLDKQKTLEKAGYKVISKWGP